MALLVVGVIVLNIVITIILLTVFLYYYNLAFECDSYPSFPCQTDWKCPGYAENDDKNVVLVNANGYGITNAMMGCYLNALYGYSVETNEFGNKCEYMENNEGKRTPILARSMTILSDRIEQVGGVDTVISAACNDNGVGVVNSSDNPFGAVCKAGAYQNVYIRTGNSPTGTPYETCDPNVDDPYCVNIAQLMCQNPISRATNTFFSNVIKSCDGAQVQI